MAAVVILAVMFIVAQAAGIILLIVVNRSIGRYTEAVLAGNTLNVEIHHTFLQVHDRQEQMVEDLKRLSGEAA